MIAMKLFEPQSGALTVQYESNEGTKLLENPPRFTWMPARLEDDRYMLQISMSDSFDPSMTFTVAAGLPETPLPSREARFVHTDLAHPRLWLSPEGAADLREQLRREPDYCGWNTFMQGSVERWLAHPLIPEPDCYPDNKRVAKLWRKMYIDCQETLYAIRHLSVAGVVLQDAAILMRAKEWLLHAASCDVNGTTSRDYNDEAAFRIAGALAWGYDWLHGELTEEERDCIRAALLSRTRQVAFHVMERSKIHQVPFDSHAVRSLSSVLVPACIALLHEEPEAKEWLDNTLEYYSCLYSPWGGEDGGWAEGPMYWTTGMAYLIDALYLVKSYTGIDFYGRPFFGKTGDFPLYAWSPDTIRASFGDQSNLGEPVSLKTGFNIRQYAGVTGNGLYQWQHDAQKMEAPNPVEKRYSDRRPGAICGRQQGAVQGSGRKSRRCAFGRGHRLQPLRRDGRIPGACPLFGEVRAGSLLHERFLLRYCRLRRLGEAGDGRMAASYVCIR